MTASFKPTPRTRLVRAPKRGSYDRELAYSIIDEAWVCHVAFVDNGTPLVVPLSHWRVGDELMVHSANKGRVARCLVQGDACITVTLLDGLVLAKSAFHHSVNYRSVMVFGRARLVENEAEKRAALAAFIDKVEPGRSHAVRPPNAAEMTSTAVCAFPLNEVSVKMRAEGVNDDPDDLALPVWSGVVPLRLVREQVSS